MAESLRSRLCTHQISVSIRRSGTLLKENITASVRPKLSHRHLVVANNYGNESQESGKRVIRICFKGYVKHTLICEILT